jgi:SAM-dependent methyltransferase/uncharacterized protein YbaR (Trm112 family)
MNKDLLDILRCPYCGSRLRLLGGRAPDAGGNRITCGVLQCQCCAYPVVDGVPYLRTGKAAEKAMALLGTGDRDGALVALLGLDETRAAFRDLRDGVGTTFREMLGTLCSDAEGAYLLYRFSDPTYLCSRAVLEAVGQDHRCFTRRVLDVGGGAGHLTRTLCRLAGPGAEVVLADVAYWKVWLAKRFVAPDCDPLCCDANAPLPFARGAFSLAACSDAFHYVWSRRLLAAELVRAVGSDGVVLLTHLHNLFCQNESVGMPLAPGDYRNLFEGIDARLFRESHVFAAILNDQPIDLSPEYADAELSGEPALILLATRLTGLFRPYQRPSQGVATCGRLAVNPLYVPDGNGQMLTLRFPSAVYEAEFAACKQYLPDRVPWGGDREARLEGGVLDEELIGLAERRVLLELPAMYC